MLLNLAARWKTLENRLAVEWGGDIGPPGARRKAKAHFYFLDHGIFRAIWANLSEVSPGVWRCNQPSPRGIRKLKKMGIKSILNLRGVNSRSPYLFEKETCDEVGIELVSCNLAARRLVPRKKMLELFDAFDTIQYPFAMHCKSGADRAGLASAIFLMHVLGASPSEAKKQLSFRYLHIRSSATGILDHMLDAYDRDNAETPMAIREWIATKYNPRHLTKQFNQARSKS